MDGEVFVDFACGAVFAAAEGGDEDLWEWGVSGEGKGGQRRGAYGFAACVADVGAHVFEVGGVLGY